MLGLNDKSEPEDEPTSIEGSGNDNADWELDKELQQELEVNIIRKFTEFTGKVLYKTGGRRTTFKKICHISKEKFCT